MDFISIFHTPRPKIVPIGFGFKEYGRYYRRWSVVQGAPIPIVEGPPVQSMIFVPSSTMAIRYPWRFHTVPSLNKAQ